MNSCRRKKLSVLDFGQLVQALDHEAVELVADWHLVLAVDLNHVVGDNSFEIGGPVDVCSDVVLIDDDGRGSGQGFQHEVFAEIGQRDAGISPRAAERTHQLAERAFAVVSGFGVKPCGFVPPDMRSYNRPKDFPKDLYDFRVVGQGFHPGLDVPVGSVFVVVDDGV